MAFCTIIHYDFSQTNLDPRVQVNVNFIDFIKVFDTMITDIRTVWDVIFLVRIKAQIQNKSSMEALFELFSKPTNAKKIFNSFDQISNWKWGLFCDRPINDWLSLSFNTHIYRFIGVMLRKYFLVLFKEKYCGGGLLRKTPFY